MKTTATGAATGGRRIRAADRMADKPAMLGFIDGLQLFEHGFEPNRRLDGTVAEEHFQVLIGVLDKHGGEIFIAEDAAARPVGWAVVHEGEDDIFVIESERRFAYIAELFLKEAARGTGLGRALIEACESWARARGVTILRIGVLPGNRRAASVYADAGFAPYALELRKRLS